MYRSWSSAKLASRSDQHRGQRDRLKRGTFALGAAAVVLGIVGSKAPATLAFVPVVTTATAALVAWIQGSRVGSMVALYQETSSQLRLRTAVWRDAAAARTQLSDEELRATEIHLAESCEEIMARENGAWRAEWLSEEKGQEAVAARERVQAATGGGGEPNRRRRRTPLTLRN